MLIINNINICFSLCVLCGKTRIMINHNGHKGFHKGTQRKKHNKLKSQISSYMMY